MLIEAAERSRVGLTDELKRVALHGTFPLAKLDFISRDGGFQIDVQWRFAKERARFLWTIRRCGIAPRSFLLVDAWCASFA